MHARSSSGTRSLLTVLYIGELGSLGREQLRDENIGVVAVTSASRAVRLLGNFRVAAIICDAPEPASLPNLVATRTPVIVLGGEDTDRKGSDVTVVSPGCSAPALAALVRQLAASSGENADRDAA